MRYVSIFPKSTNIKNTLERLNKIAEQNQQHHNGIGLRIEPNIAQTLSRHSAIRELKRYDHIDIVGRQTAPHRSILYLDENVKIKKKGEKYYFFF